MSIIEGTWPPVEADAEAAWLVALAEHGLAELLHTELVRTTAWADGYTAGHAAGELSWAQPTATTRLAIARLTEPMSPGAEAMLSALADREARARGYVPPAEPGRVDHPGGPVDW